MKTNANTTLKFTALNNLLMDQNIQADKPNLNGNFQIEVANQGAILITHKPNGYITMTQAAAHEALRDYAEYIKLDIERANIKYTDDMVIRVIVFDADAGAAFIKDFWVEYVE